MSNGRVERTGAAAKAQKEDKQTNRQTFHEPESRLCDILSTTKEVIAFISGTRGPETDVKETFKNLRFVNFEMQVGSPPNNPAFKLRSRLTKAWILQRTLGMELETFVLAIDSQVRAVRKPKLAGMAPVRPKELYKLRIDQ